MMCSLCVGGLENGVPGTRKCYVNHKTLHKGSIINFKVEKKGILGPSYGRLKFIRCINTHRNYKCNLLMYEVTTSLKSYHICNTVSCPHPTRFLLSYNCPRDSL